MESICMAPSRGESQMENLELSVQLNSCLKEIFWMTCPKDKVNINLKKPILKANLLLDFLQEKDNKLIIKDNGFSKVRTKWELRKMVYWNGRKLNKTIMQTIMMVLLISKENMME